MGSQKNCSKGHVLEASWKICPYCGEAVVRASDAVPPELKKTVREDVAFEHEKAEEARAAEAKKTKIIKEKSPEIKALAWLIATDGPMRATTYQIIKGKTTVGNTLSCDIQFQDEYVSSQHASFHFDKGRYTLTDLDSANGTYVNGKRVTKRGLEDGDRIKIGETTYVFKYFAF
ncbi:MAG: FHA domain-containing protein [Candidatus Aminicenantales bacterium]